MASLGRALAVGLAICALAACGAPGGLISTRRVDVAPDVYVVRPGDTLYAIASRFGLDYRDVARRNGLGDGSLIYPGQRLKLAESGPSNFPARGARGEAPAADAEPVPVWRWPAAGPVVAGFGQSPRTASGILIAGRPGEPISAAADGEIVYAGSGLTGYGQLVIIKHNDAWLSAYGHNERLLVREGDQVRGGQPIAQMGPGAGQPAVLHFEIRRDGEPLDPLAYLPRQR